MQIGVLGPFAVSVGGAAVALGGGKQRALLARLALEPGRAVSLERIVPDLWGEDPPSSAVKMVYIGVSQLRKALPGAPLQTAGGGAESRAP